MAKNLKIDKLNPDLTTVTVDNRDTALEISENGVKTGDLSCNNLTVDGKADIKKTGALVIESPASTVSNKHLVLSNITQSTLGTDGLGASIDFDQTYMYDLSTPVHGVDSGRIEVLCEQDWTTTSSTRDSEMKFKTALNGSLETQLTISSAGAVATTGALTVGSVSEVGSDTDKILMSDSGVVKYVTGANLRSYIGAGTSSVGALNDLSDVTYSSGDLTISSLDKIIASDFVVDSGASVELDAHNGNFVAKKAGDEFSVANSAYAGMILGYTTDGIDAARSSKTLTAAFAVTASAHKVKFVAPPSGVVEIFVSIYGDFNRRQVYLGLSDSATYNAVDVTHEHSIYLPWGATAGDVQIDHRWVITGLTAGDSEEYWLGAKSTHIMSNILRWGGDASGEYQPFIMKATALPAATTDYAVYG